MIRPPWTEAQVVALNQWQDNPDVHPFTCANRNDMDKHGRFTHRFVYGDRGALRATVNGWICLDCDYTQKWAYQFMAPQNPVGQFITRFYGR